MTSWGLLHQCSYGACRHRTSFLRDKLPLPADRPAPTFSQALAPSRPPIREAFLTTCRSSFYGGNFFRKPIEEKQDLIPQRCSQCGGTGRCTCADCGGRGRLSRAGYNKKNRVDMTRIVGSKWTAMEETMGWRHFRVIQCRKGASGVAFVQLQASCDPATQLWINATNLKDRDLWAAGWLQKSEMEDPQGALTAGVTCRACSGSGSTACPVCDATGAVLVPPSPLSSLLMSQDPEQGEGATNGLTLGAAKGRSSSSNSSTAGSTGRTGSGGSGSGSGSRLSTVLSGSRVGGGARGDPGVGRGGEGTVGGSDGNGGGGGGEGEGGGLSVDGGVLSGLEVL